MCVSFCRGCKCLICNEDDICYDCGHDAAAHKKISIAKNQVETVTKTPMQHSCHHEMDMSVLLQTVSVCKVSDCPCVMCDPAGCKACDHSCGTPMTIEEHQDIVRDKSCCKMCHQRGVVIEDHENLCCKCNVCSTCWNIQFNNGFMNCPLCSAHAGTFYTVYRGWQ